MNSKNFTPFLAAIVLTIVVEFSASFESISKSLVSIDFRETPAIIGYPNFEIF